jgi:hypothetical protein
VVVLLQQFPTEITAGLSVNADIVSADFPAPDWDVIAVLRGPDQIDLMAVENGTAHRFVVDATTTSGWTAGLYAVQIRAVMGAEIYEIESGDLVVHADLSAVAGTHDPRGHAQKVLTAIEAVIEGRATKDQDSYKINGRELVRTSIADLLELRKTYKAEVAALNSNGRHKRLLGRKVRVRF